MKWLKRIPSRVDRAIVVMMVSTGLLLPWAVAIGVKLYLQALGKPTVPWETIAVYAMYFGLFGSVIAATPLIILASLYGDWTVGKRGWMPRATTLQRRLVVLFAFAGCAAGMVHAFVDVFWEFDALVLWFLPYVVVLYLPWMAAGLVVGALVAVIAGFVVRRSSRAGPRERDAGEGGGSGPDGRRDAGELAASARDGTGGGVLDAEIAGDARSRARSLRNAASAAAVATIVAGAISLSRGSPDDILEYVLFGVVAASVLWAVWAIHLGAWLLGTGWRVGFLVCLALGLPLLVFGVAVFLKLRRMSSEDGRGRPEGHARPPRMAGA